MRTAFAVLLGIHGLIHLLGFLKAFDLATLDQLSLPISRPMGALWGLAALLMILFALFFGFSLTGYAWALGALALLLSQFLILSAWSDARFGTIPNVILLLLVLGQFGQWRFHRMTEHEIHSLLSGIGPISEEPLTEDQLHGLPVPVQRWIQRSGALGKPAIQVARISQNARMKMRPGQKEWTQANALQYTLTADPAFHWTVELRYNALLSFRGRDQYIDGHGQMLILMNALVPVVKASGPQLDEGTMQRYLGELVWLPSLATSRYIHWEPLDSLSARATMNYQGVTGSGEFYFNTEGDFVKYVAQRFQGSGPEARRYPWEISATETREFGGIRVPSALKATWKLDEGDWTWLEMDITGIWYNKEAIP